MEVRGAEYLGVAALQLGPEQPGESPGQLRRLEPGDGVLQVGGQGPTPRRRVGIRGARDRRADVPVGEQRAFFPALLEALDRKRKHVSGDVRGRLVLQRRFAVWAPRHGGQRLGVDRQWLLVRLHQ